MLSSPPLIVFDLGGVLIRICRSWAEGCAAAGLPVRNGADAPDRIDARRALSASYQLGRLSCDEFFERISETTGGAYTPAEIARIHDAWLLGRYDGTADLLAGLHDAGVSVGILSNTNHRHWASMQRDHPDLWRTDHPHASHLMELAKPDPAIYRAFEERTGATPDRIVFFDDTEENVAAAGSAGWSAHLVDHTGDTAAQMRRVLASLGVL